MEYFVRFLAIMATLSTTFICETHSARCTGPTSCFAPTRDLSTVAGVSITSNSTCGLHGTEDFCVNQACNYKCDASVPSQFHGANLTIDKFGDKTFWKSQNFHENVVLQLDLGHSYFFTEIFATFEYEYPAAMYIAKSDNYGTSWKTLGYLSIDCKKHFGMDAVEDKNRNGFAAECIRLDPATANENPQATYSPWRDTKFGANIISNYTLQEEFLATNFRLVLVKFKTPSGFNPKTADKRSFYFAVRDWHVDGHCYCKGQSNECQKEESWKCNCLKNTTGDNCEKCQPLLNNAKYDEGKTCEECECYNHSSNCTFNETKGHGVCQDCTGNTTGDSCENCLPNYFNAAVPLEHPKRCQACDCHESGITNQPNSDLCNQTTGQCDCKTNVTSRTCGECKDGYWNLTKSNPDGCQICKCVTAGTVNASNICDKKTGQCQCRKPLAGLRCTKCKDGYFGLTKGNPNFCDDCSCFPEGSVNITCDQTSGDCYCRQNFNGSKCSTLAPNHYVPGVLEMTYEAIKPDSSVVYNATSGVSGVLIDGYSASRSVVFNVNIPKTFVYTIVVRYQTVVDWDNATLTVQSLSTPFQPYSCDGMKPVTNQSFTLTTTLKYRSDAANFGDNCMSEGQYRLTLEFPLIIARSLSPSSVLVDSVVILPSIGSFKYPAVTNETLFYYHQSFSHASWSRDKTEIQKSLGPYFSALYGGGKACSCNQTGSFNHTTCDHNGGQCSCKSSVGGLNCAGCQPAHYNFSASGCRACNCDSLRSNSSQCDLRTGKCQCRPGVEGMQCSRCKVNYYGFQRGIGCSPCLCDPTYSTNLQCNENGACDCLPGVHGERCMTCNGTSFNLTTKGCDPCSCQIDGSASLTCDKQTGNCTCKPMAVGQKCDSCPRGYFYGLSKYHPGGCLKCQCTGKSVNCSSKDNMYETSVKSDWYPPNIQNGLFAFDGWNTTTSKYGMDFQFIGKRPEDMRIFMEVTVLSNKNVYFVAPASFLGDKRTAYQHSLSFYLLQSDTRDPFYSSEGDVILKGRWFNQSLVHKFNKRPKDTDPSEFKVFFGEGHWTVGDVNGRNASSYELVTVLSELTNLLIRAKWSNKTGEKTSLGIINMYLSREFLNSSEAPAGARMTESVEKCDCPRQFQGDSCERCSPGYTRDVPNTGPNTQCVSCRCNGNSEQCDSETGVCMQCKHNTTGDHCERCSVGYYGNASLGTADACRPCSCYGGHNTCNVTANADDSFVCNCGPGYEGRQCETCSDGYYGTPKLGVSCKPCECNDNSRTCNRTTGDCSAFCQSNTTGFNCEWCMDGFFGEASTRNCQECNCTDLGSVNNVCNRTTGYCTCLENVQGKTCSDCFRGAWGYDNGTGCNLCNCSKHGAISEQCNMTTGVCSCKQNVTGTKCDQCTPGLYDVAQGCIDCQCNMTYSNDSICDTYTGQCVCKQSSDGGFFGGRQCTDCRWDAVGMFPSCAHCNETCYANWYKLIEIEREKVNDLANNVTEVLQTFNGTSVQDINKTLSELNTKLNYSEEIFSGAQFRSKEKEEKYKEINQTMVKLNEMLDQANKSLNEVRNYLTNVVEPFDGTVNITSERPPVLANYSSLRARADKILADVKAYNKTAYEYYQNITSNYEEVKRYNESGVQTAAEVKQALKRLDEIANKTNEANSILDKEFYDNVKRNNEALENLRKDSENISRLVNESSALSRKATQMLNYARGNLSTAHSEANSNLRESTIVYNSSAEAQRKAYKAMNISVEFKMNATDLLNKVDNAVTDVKNGINKMALATAITENATAIADGVLAITIPVKEKTIHDLSSEILKIAINETLVNATYDDATAGLKTAQEAQRLSEEAMNISKHALAQVKEIELKMQEALEYRDEARNMQNSTDKMVQEIVRITSEVESEFSNASKVGRETLDLLNRTIEDIDKSLKCFNESKEIAINATNMATLAYKQILNASMTYNDSRSKLYNIEASLNSSYSIAMNSYREIIETNQNATELFEEVKEAEDLLKSYVEQRDEMDELKAEVTLLETQVDSLNEDLDKRLKEYETCSND